MITNIRFAKHQFTGLLCKFNSYSHIPEFVTDLSLCTNNEDFMCEIFVLENALPSCKSVRALTVVGGGDTSISLLQLPKLRYLTCIDRNVAQIHLLNFKRGCLRSLMNEDIIRKLVGREGLIPGFSTIKTADRIKLYCEQVRGKIPLESLSYWDKRMPLEIANGILNCGESERLFQKMLHNIKASIKLSSKNPHQFTLHDFKEVMPVEVLDEVTHGLFRLLQAEGPHSSLQSNWFLSNHLYSTFPTGLSGVSAPWTSLAGGSYQEVCPIETVCKDISQYADELNPEEKYDFVSLSNIYDWTTDEDTIASLSTLIPKLLHIGGVGLLRGAQAGLFPLLECVTDVKLLDDINRELYSMDRNPLFYRHPRIDGAVVAFERIR